MQEQDHGQEHDTDDLVERSALTSSYFLSAFAMLYVVGDSLPKTHFLTRVDKLIVSTIVTISLSGLLSRMIYSIHMSRDQATAEQWNFWVERGLAMLYVISNIYVFGPPWFQMRRHISKLLQADLPPLLPTTVTASPLSSQGLPQLEPKGLQRVAAPGENEQRALPLVPSGGRYIQLKHLVEGSRIWAASGKGEN